ncbi:SMP-30/gluconolactonase/LRE family protein [Tenacibaculum aiptasiae]|uniref:SMP-30/gluconolactonase/LRE family protein n=1 Tax=Tenacibaculum aiptasiae TaxID=426481 RepID=UPI003B5D0363
MMLNRLKERKIAVLINILLLVLGIMVLEACKVKNYSVEAVLEYQTPAKLGEGAFWDYKKKNFIWVDIEKKRLHIYNPLNKKNRTITMPSKIGTVVPSETGDRVVVALEDGIYVVNINTEEISLLSGIESLIKENRFNDGKCDPSGNLWVGSMNLKQTTSSGKLYKVDNQGKTTTMLENITISNGIVWTKKGDIMYYIDTPTGNIRAFDFDLKTSTISNERIVVKINQKDGFPDGMTIDENDMLWVGMWNGNAVAQYNPKTGKLVSKIKVPAHNVTSCAFGGENLDKLYITTASVDMTKEEREKYPLAGSLFVAIPGVKGVRSSYFKTPVYNKEKLVVEQIK